MQLILLLAQTWPRGIVLKEYIVSIWKTF